SAVVPVNVDGARPLRRGGGRSAPRARSDLGQASSNVAGGTSLDSTGGGAAGAGRNPVADGSAARVCARSRSFRDDEENSRLRRGLTAGAVSADCGTGGASLRVRSRAAASSSHGAGGGADGCASASALP